MKTIHYFLFALMIIAMFVLFLQMWAIINGYEPFVLGAILATFKTFIVFFNGAAAVLALPLLTGKRNAVAFYNMAAGKNVFWGMVSGFCYAYLLVWVLYALMPLDFISGLNLFNHSYDYMNNTVTYHLPIFGKYVINSYQWDTMYFIVFIGILGVKFSFLATRWSETLRDGELIITPGGHIY